MKKLLLILIALTITTAADFPPTTPNGLEAELLIPNPQVKTLGDLNVTLKLTNISTDDLIQFHNLNNLQLYIKIRDRSGQMYINDSDKTADEQTEEKTISGVTRIIPGQVASYNYFGLKQPPLPPGNYQAQFDFRNSDGAEGDWVGEVKSKWVDFTLLGQ